MGMSTAANISLYPWFRFFQNLNFWQAVWFLYFQSVLGPAEAIMLYVVYDVATTALEVPSGYLSDRLGRKKTLTAAALAAIAGTLCLYGGNGFALLAVGQALLGAGSAFASGTDSALLYESLAREARNDETADQELRAWRFGFTALALSAVAGGLMSLADPALPFLAGALAAGGMLVVTLQFVEPDSGEQQASRAHPEGAEVLQSGALKAAFAQPALRWIFGLAVLMYGYSHIPFVFGQPFILQALDGLGLAGEAPLVSGSVSAAMMLISVSASLYAVRLRARLGLPAILLLAFAMQVALAGVLASSAHVLAIGFLLLRMVPNSLSQPFLLARIHPLLRDDMRATFLSLQSFFGRLFFAATLWLASANTSASGVMEHADMSRILWAYAAGGALCLALLALTARQAGVEDSPRN